MELILSRIDFSIQSRTVNTEIMQKIPMVMPNNDKNVRSLLAMTELIANKKPSFRSLKNIFLKIFN